MRIKLSTITALMLSLLVVGFVSAGNNDCATPKATSTTSATKPGIAIRKAEKDVWTYKVTNTGNVQLTNVRVTDNKLAAMNCQQDVLAAGESMGCTAKEATSASTGCATADHVVYNEAGVSVTTQGDCVTEGH